MGYQEEKQFADNGKRFDPAVGLYDYGFRDYTPVLGRWTTLDPVRDGTNWYAYVNNDPINFVDPLGLAKNPIDIGLKTSDFFSPVNALASAVAA